MPFKTLADLTETAPYKKNLADALHHSTGKSAPFLYFEGFSLGAHYGPLLLVGKVDGGLVRKVKDSGAKLKSSGQCTLPSGESIVKFLIESGDVNAGKLNTVLQSHKVGFKAEIVPALDGVPATNGATATPQTTDAPKTDGVEGGSVDLQMAVMKRWKKVNTRNEVVIGLAADANRQKLQLASKGFSLAAKGKKWDQANKLLDIWSGTLDEVEAVNRAEPAEKNRQLAVAEEMKVFPAVKNEVGVAVPEASEEDKLLLGRMLLKFETLEKGAKTTAQDIRQHVLETRQAVSEVEARTKERKVLKEAEEECKKTLIKSVSGDLKSAQEDAAISPEDKKLLSELSGQFKKLLEAKTWVKLRDELKKAPETIDAVKVRTEERRKRLKEAEEECGKLGTKIAEDVKKADEDPNISADDKKVLDQLRQQLNELTKRQDWLELLPDLQKLPDAVKKVEERTAERKVRLEALRKEMAVVEKQVNTTKSAAARKDAAALDKAWKAVEDLADKGEIDQATEALKTIPSLIEKLDKAIVATREQLAVRTKAQASDELEKKKLAIEAQKTDRIDKAQKEVRDAEEAYQKWQNAKEVMSGKDRKAREKEFEKKIAEAKERVLTTTEQAENAAREAVEKAVTGLENRELDLQQIAGDLARDFSPDEVDALFKSAGPDTMKALSDQVDGTRMRELFDAGGSGGVALVVRAIPPAQLKGLLDAPGAAKVQALGTEFGEEGLKNLNNQLKGKKLGELLDKDFTPKALKELQDAVGLPKLRSLGNEFAADELAELHAAAGPKLAVLTNAFDPAKLHELQGAAGTEKLKKLAEGFEGDQLKKLCDGVDAKSLKTLAGRDDNVYTLQMLLPLAKKENAADLVELLDKASGPKLKGLLEATNKYKQPLSHLKTFLADKPTGDGNAYSHHVGGEVISSCRVTNDNPKPKLDSNHLKTLMDLGRVKYVRNGTPQMQDGTYFDEYKVVFLNENGTPLAGADDDWIIHIHKGKNPGAVTGISNEGHMKRVSERYWGANNPVPTQRNPYRSNAGIDVKEACVKST